MYKEESHESTRRERRTDYDHCAYTRDTCGDETRCTFQDARNGADMKRNMYRTLAGATEEHGQHRVGTNEGMSVR